MPIAKGSKLLWKPSVLSDGDRADKLRLERIITSYLGEKRIEAGSAMLEYQNRNLYLDEFSSFGQCVREKWGMKLDLANRIMASVPPEIRARITDSGVRVELEKLPESSRGDVWVNGSTAQSADWTRTTSHSIRIAKEKVFPPPETPDGLEPIELTLVTQPRPEDLAAAAGRDWNTKVEAFVAALKDLKTHFAMLAAECPTQAGYRLVDPGRVGEAMKSIADHVRASKAVAICGYCKGRMMAVGLDEQPCPCAACSGRGWTTAMSEQQASDDQKGEKIE
jgi:hypothetical protein